MFAQFVARAFRALRGNAARQAMLVAGAAVPAGAVLSAVQEGWAPVWIGALLLWLVGVAAFLASAELARSRTRTFDDVGHALAGHLARGVVQASLALLVPCAVAIGAVLLASRAHPLLGFALIPALFIGVLPFAVGLSGMAALAALHGDRSWWPRAGIELVRSRPGLIWIVVVAGGVAAGFAVMPVLLVGVIAMTTWGPVASFGSGLAAMAVVPVAAAVGLTAWRVLGGRAVRAPGAALAEGSIAARAPALTWITGPVWDLELEPSGSWGTWIDLPDDGTGAPQLLGVTIAVSPGARMPRLLTCDAAGSWLEWPVPQESGTLLPIELQAGASYVQLVDCTGGRHAARLTLSVLGVDEDVVQHSAA